MDYYPVVNEWINIEKLNQNRQYSFLRTSGILEIGLVTNDVDEGIRIIDLANQIFIARNINEETRNLGNAINFLENSIKTVEVELEQNKEDLKTSERRIDL